MRTLAALITALCILTATLGAGAGAGPLALLDDCVPPPPPVALNDDCTRPPPPPVALNDDCTRPPRPQATWIIDDGEGGSRQA